MNAVKSQQGMCWQYSGQLVGRVFQSVKDSAQLCCLAGLARLNAWLKLLVWEWHALAGANTASCIC